MEDEVNVGFQITGLDVSSWGAACGMNPAAAGGYLAVCLDTLADFYVGPDRSGPIRMVEFESPGEREAAD